MKKYIFLDFDGVLNTENNIKALREQGLAFSDKYGYYFENKAVANLAAIVEQTKAEIVISSTWKMDGLDIMKKMWLERNLPGKVIDITPSDLLGMQDIDFNNPDSFVGRGREIQQWIQQNGSTKDRYVILDDLDDMLQSQKPFFIQINPQIGITPKDAGEAVKILNHDDNNAGRALSRKAVSDICGSVFEDAVSLACAGQQEAAIFRMERIFSVLPLSNIGYEVIAMFGFYCQLCIDTKQYDKAEQVFKIGIELIEEEREKVQDSDSYEEDINNFLDLKIKLDLLSPTSKPH